MRLPPIAVIEAEMIRRGLEEKLVPVGEDGQLPRVVASADRLSGKYRQAFLTAIRSVKSVLNLAEIAQAIRTDRVAGILEPMVDEAITRALNQPTTDHFHAGYLAGARVGAAQLRPLGVILRQGGQIRFDLVNAHAVQWASRYAGQLITEITKNQRRTISDLVVGSVRNGHTVEEIAREVRNIIGLHSRQVETLVRYRGVLEERETPPARIEQLVERRATGMLFQRSRMIARTEILDAANSGQRGLWQEAAAEGLFDKEKARKVWVTTQDDLAEEYCLELDGVEVGLDEQFESELGSVDGPTLHPGCRCGMNLTFDRS